MSDECVLVLDFDSRVKIRASIKANGSTLIRNLVKEHYKTARISTIETVSDPYIMRITFANEQDKLEFIMKHL